MLTVPPTEHELHIDVRQQDQVVRIDLTGGTAEDYALLEPVIETLEQGSGD